MKMRESHTDITHEQLLDLVYYNKTTGQMFKTSTFNNTGHIYPCYVREITSVNNNGYKWINLKGRNYLVHRLAVFYMTGKYPKYSVTLKDNSDRLNTRWNNIVISRERLSQKRTI